MALNIRQTPFSRAKLRKSRPQHPTYTYSLNLKMYSKSFGALFVKVISDIDGITTLVARRNRPSAQPWLGGDNRLGRLNMWSGAAWLSGLVAALALLPE